MGFSGFGFDSAQGGVAGFAPSQGASSGGYSPGTLLDDIQYHFKFDSISGLLTDSITSSVLSSTNSPSTEVGVVGQSIGFNDTDESRASSTTAALLTAADEVPNATEGLNVAYPFTIILWAYPEQKTGYSSQGRFVQELESSGDNWVIYAYNVNSAVSCNFSFGLAGSGSMRLASLTGNQAMDSWHCIVCQWYGCNYDQNGAFSVGGSVKRVSVVTGAAGSGSITETQVQTCCGEHMLQGTELQLSQPPGYDINGRIDLFTRWNRILTTDEILQFYNRSKAGLAPI